MGRDHHHRSIFRVAGRVANHVAGGVIPTAIAAAVVALVASIATASATTAAQTGAAVPRQAGPSELHVGIKPLDPFVVRKGSDYQGFSIELWDEIARRNQWTTTYTWYDTLKPLLDDVAGAKVDAAIAGISITKEREAKFDFSYPMFNAGLQVMTGAKRSSPVADQLGKLLTGSLGKYLLGMIAALVVGGLLSWIITRRHHHADERPTFTKGVGLSIYRAAAVGLAGDLGSAEARRPVGRFFAIVWLIFGICFVSLFTAAVASQLTVQSIRSGINGIDDLPGKRVLTVKNTTAANYLTGRGIAFTGTDSIDDAYRLLDDRQADAIVFDAPVLRHRAVALHSSRETLVGDIFQHEDYGIALPSGSSRRKAINETLLEMRADGFYDRLYEHYFGTRDR